MFISFGGFSFQLLYPFLYSFFSFTRLLAYKKDAVNPYISFLLVGMAQMSVGVFELISMYLQIRREKEQILPINEVKNERKKEKSEDDFYSVTEEDKKTIPIIKNLCIIFCLSLFNSFVYLIYFGLENLTYLTTYNFQNEVRFIGIFYLIMLCRLAFKSEFHRHHILSIGLITFFETLLVMICIFILQNDKKLDIGITITKFALLLFCDIYFSTRYAIDKWLMDKRFISPFRLLFLEGFFSTIIDILIMFVFSYFPCNDAIINCQHRTQQFTFHTFYDDVINHPFFICIFFFSSIFIELFITLTNKNFTPAYRPIFDMLPSFLSLFIGIGNTVSNVDASYYLPYKIIIYILILISTLIFNEIIILHFWGLSKNIKKNIEERGENEFQLGLMGLQDLNSKKINNVIS